MREPDCRGPAIQTEGCLEKEHHELIKVFADNEAAKQNVSRFLESRNFQLTVEQDGPVLCVTGKGEDGAAPVVTPSLIL